MEEVEQQAIRPHCEGAFRGLLGRNVAPDATFTLRLAFGVVKGYRVDGVDLPFHTTFGGAFARAEQQGNREPFVLPKRWLKNKDKLDLKTPFDFVSTADTIGGNSGSPVLNRAGEVVGINFDRNRHGLVRKFVYTEEQARHIAVHGLGVLEALRKLYDAGPLLKELTGASCVTASASRSVKVFFRLRSGCGFFSADCLRSLSPLNSNLVPKHTTPSGCSRSGPAAAVSLGCPFGTASPLNFSDWLSTPLSGRKTRR